MRQFTKDLKIGLEACKNKQTKKKTKKNPNLEPDFLLQPEESLPAGH